MKLNRRELIRTVAVVAAIWVAILVVAARWQGRAERAGGKSTPELVHYPGTENIEEQHSANLGFRKYWFTLNEDYPSKSVYYFYSNELEPKGWMPLHRGEPRWVRQVAKNEARDVFQAMWGSPDNLFQLQLDMMSVAKPVDEGEPLSGEAREPGIEVFVTLQRTLHPGLIMQPKAPTARPGVEIEPGE